ncbi:MAG: citramalate synthase [Planctomycetota bacterium]
MAHRIEIYDTTLRDGSQGEGVSFSSLGKLEVARKLDAFGIHYIEGGWPGSNPKDMEFFAAAKKVKFRHARLAAFGSTRHARHDPADDPNLRALVESRASVVTIFGKCWDLHVTDALRVTLPVNLDMIASSVAYLKKRCGTVFFDAEHFYDGYKADPEYALQALETAANAGAARLVLCDTNGGSLPSEIGEITEVVRKRLPGAILGIHTHNDCNLAVANAVAAVQAGARQVQGTMNGIGERCGNCDLTSVIPILERKMGYRTIGPKNLRHLTEVSRYVYEMANVPLLDRQPFVGKSAFAHKGGVHVSAVSRNERTYEHLQPETVGNERRILISELSGKSNILARSKIDLSKNPEAMKKILDRIMQLELEGYSFESADASFDLLVRRTLGLYEPFFKLLGFRVTSESRGEDLRISEATVRLEVQGRFVHTVAEGTEGPVGALDNAFRKALVPHYRKLDELRLVDYKVVIVDPSRATAAHVRVTVESADRSDVWITVGASENVIEASLKALIDAYEYKLLKDFPPDRRGRKARAKRGRRRPFPSAR